MQVCLKVTILFLNSCSLHGVFLSSSSFIGAADHGREGLLSCEKTKKIGTSMMT